MKHRVWFARCLGMMMVWSAVAGAADVQVKKAQDQWQLIVDGEPFFVKGVGSNEATGRQGEDYLQMAKDMGANAVRTWGETKGSYLDQAQRLDMKVAVGFWLNAVRAQTPDSYRDPERRAELKKQILEGIQSMKRHPAVLLWIIGTEVFSHTQDEAEKKAFGEFLTDLFDAVHRVDPHHPIVYSTADDGDLPDLVAKVRNVDIIGIDTYGALGQSMGWLDRHRVDKPALVTEFGPHGAWEAQKDKNDMAFDPADSLKASDYESTWRQIEAARGRCLGGFAFVLGEPRNQDSVGWFNINEGPLKRKAYWLLYHAYTGLALPHPIPYITEFAVITGTGVPAGSRFTVKAKAAVQDGGELKYQFSIAKIFSDPLIVELPKYLPADEKSTGPGEASLLAPSAPDIYRVYVVVTDSHGNAAVANRSLRVTAP